MTRLALLLLVACGSGGAQVPVVPAKPISHTPAAPQAPALDEAAVKARSKAWLDALDRYDVAGFTELLSKSFVLFEHARFLDEALLVKIVQARKDRHAPIGTRTWSNERVFLGENVATFVGHSALHIPAFAGERAYDEEGWNTVVWAREGDRWLVAHFQWQAAGKQATAERWNSIYRNDAGFNKQPNQLLVDAVKGRKPGTAIDIAMGQGRNAVFLAAHGWKTTGIDIADEGIRQAQAEAARQKVKLDTVLADIDSYDFGTAKWDLVTLIYAGANAKLVERVKPSIKKGGLFVSEYFHADSEVAKTGAGGWKTGELAALFRDGFQILRDDVVEDHADWAGQRKTKLVRFVAQKL